MGDAPKKHHLAQEQEALFWQIVESEEYKKRFEGFKVLSRRQNNFFREHPNPKMRSSREFYTVQNLKNKIIQIEQSVKYYRTRLSLFRSWDDQQKIEHGWRQKLTDDYERHHEEMKEYLEDMKDELEQVAWVRDKMKLGEN